MIEVRLVLDEIDYDLLAERLLPLAADKMEEKGGVLGLLGRNRDGLGSVARHLLKTMSQDKRDELLLQLLSEKKQTILAKANQKAAEEKLGVKVLDASVRKIK